MSNSIRIKYLAPSHVTSAISVTVSSDVTFNNEGSILSARLVSALPADGTQYNALPGDKYPLSVVTSGFNSVSNAYIAGLCFYCDGQPSSEYGGKGLDNGDKIIPDFAASKWKYPEDEEPEAKDSFSFKYVKSVSLS